MSAPTRRPRAGPPWRTSCWPSSASRRAPRPRMSTSFTRPRASTSRAAPSEPPRLGSRPGRGARCGVPQADRPGRSRGLGPQEPDEAADGRTRRAGDTSGPPGPRRTWRRPRWPGWPRTRQPTTASRPRASPTPRTSPPCTPRSRPAPTRTCCPTGRPAGPSSSAARPAARRDPRQLAAPARGHEHLEGRHAPRGRRGRGRSPWCRGGVRRVQGAPTRPPANGGATAAPTQTAPSVDQAKVAPLMQIQPPTRRTSTP